MAACPPCLLTLYPRRPRGLGGLLAEGGTGRVGRDCRDAAADRPTKTMKQRQAPGLAIAVLRDGRTVYREMRSASSISPSGEPVTADTRFHLASVTKTFVATAVLQLAEQGKGGPRRASAPVPPLLPACRPAGGEDHHSPGARPRLRPSEGRRHPIRRPGAGRGSAGTSGSRSGEPPARLRSRREVRLQQPRVLRAGRHRREGLRAQCSRPM